MKLNREDYSKVTESPEFKLMMAESAIDKIDDNKSTFELGHANDIQYRSRKEA